MLGMIYGRSSARGSGGGGGGNLLSGSDDPSVNIGVDNDYYINKTNSTLFGPKTGGLWPAPIPLGGATVVSRMDSTDPFIVQQAGAQTITLPVTNPIYLELYLNGILQPENYFTINGAVVTVNASLGVKAGDSIEFTYEYVTAMPGMGGGAGGPTNYIDEIPMGSIDGVNKVFSLSYIPNMNSLSLYINGLRADNDDYTLSGTTITFNLTPTKKIRATYTH